MYFDQDAEAEDRAIAEAIAREEELMRQEEERELEISRTFDADFQRIEEEILRKEGTNICIRTCHEWPSFSCYPPRTRSEAPVCLPRLSTSDTDARVEARPAYECESSADDGGADQPSYRTE